LDEFKNNKKAVEDPKKSVSPVKPKVYVTYKKSPIKPHPRFVKKNMSPSPKRATLPKSATKTPTLLY
jgi:hypothetical protein